MEQQIRKRWFDGSYQKPKDRSVSASLEIKVNDITLCVTELTSSELLTKVLQVIRDVK